MNDSRLKKRREIDFLKLKKTDAQEFIQFVKDKLGKKSIINQKYKIEQQGNDILFPLVDRKNFVDNIVKAVQNFIPVEIITKKGIDNPNFKFKTLEDALNGKIYSNHFKLIPRSYDIIGNIAILEFEKSDQINNNEFNSFKNLVAKAVIEVNHNVKSVFEKKSEIKGPYRLRNLDFLVGKNKTETLHKENDCIFHLDVKTTYFTPRLVHERRRISKSDIQENEVIVDMFAGVGPFSIQIAKLNSVEIHAFDVNPNAYGFLKKNISENNLMGEVNPYHMNVKDLIAPSNQIGKKICNKIDRIIMNLPESSINFIDVACFLMKQSGGILHFYQFSEKPNAINLTIKNLNTKLKELNWGVDKIFNSKIVKSFSPKIELVVVDIFMKSMTT